MTPINAPDAPQPGGGYAQASQDCSGEIYLTDLKPGSREAWPPTCGAPAGSKP